MNSISFPCGKNCFLKECLVISGRSRLHAEGCLFCNMHAGRSAAREAAEREGVGKLEAAQNECKQLEERLRSQHDAEMSGLRQQLQDLQR